MDEVLEKFNRAFCTRGTDNNITNFDGLFKNWGKLGNQEERRRELLDVQRSNRNNKLDNFRGIFNFVKDYEGDLFHNTSPDAYYRPSIYVAGFTKTSTAYNNVLMMSEWIVEKPEDFNENWYVTPCPKGTRMLVVANKGKTKCYTKYGQFKTECRTALPGGTTNVPGFTNRYCVLDCFYVEKANTMYVVDLLAWNSQPMTDGETEFRHFWLQSHLEDIPELKTLNKRNNMIFSILPKVSCSLESFNTFMMTCPHFTNNSPALDGLLFYHKNAHYVAGQTPLVGWLYPYMVQEVLGADITVNQVYTLNKPENYVNQAEFIQKFEEKNAKRHTPNNYRQRKNSSMDTTPVEPDIAVSTNKTPDIEDNKTTKKNNNNQNSKKKSNKKTTSSNSAAMEADEEPTEQEAKEAQEVEITDIESKKSDDNTESEKMEN